MYVALYIYGIVFACYAGSALGFILSDPWSYGPEMKAHTPEGVRLPVEMYYEFQTLDHFDGGDFKYWRQRYFVNNATYRPDGPLFLMLHGQSAANPVWMVTGAWHEYARQHGALMVMLEHRFFGESQPTDNVTSESLRFLSSRQALADVASFVDYIKEFYMYHLKGSKVIVFGGGYAGSLAVWMRSKYPYVVDGAVASSPPLTAIMDFADYYVGVANSLSSVSPACRANIKTATDTMFEWYGQPEKRSIMNNIFRLCEKINHGSLMDLTMFFWRFAENFARVVQYNKLDLSFMGITNNNVTMDDVCAIMTDESLGDPVHRYAAVNSLLLDTDGRQCTNIKYPQLVQSLNQTTWGSWSAMGGRQRLYQQCSEFGWSRSSWTNKVFNPWFAFPFNFTTDQCIDAFQQIFGGEQVTDNCAETNRYYGGLNLPVSNVVIVNGAVDPWHRISATGQLPNASGDYEVILLESTSHCADMLPPMSTDPQELTEARLRISKHIATWLG
ncbi:putative serine protease K12H4.7 isoform X2 [Mya arenaria]|uniref:putative serine protease K12H4.7 isoform X2 n=1 Tax=Mya arenaria TaxID=6604 RepID=UPI0022DFDF4A|nr:putative serine protease K12H4.7 isoform X2 [Mya arenaria]